MKKFNISRQLALLVVLSVGVSMAVFGVLYFLLRQSQQASSRVTLQVLEQSGSSYRLLEDIDAVEASLQQLLRLKDIDELEKALEKFQAQDKQLALQLAGLGAVGQGILSAYQELGKAELVVLDSLLKGNNGQAYEKLMSEVTPRREALLGEIRKFQAAAATQVLAELETRRQIEDRNLWLQGGIISAVLCGVALYGWSLRRRIVRRLLELTVAFGEASEELADASQQVSGSSQSLAEGASEQAASLEETSASLEQMASMTKRNAENAQSAKELARDTRAAADTGAADMAEMNLAMGAIKASSDNIAKIIRTIDEIAFQTNILALNAAVEAARAGQSGAGFAVVADEVRSLAQRSKKAAQETAEKIEDSIQKSARGVEISNKVNESLAEIVSKARQVDELVAEIATASREQSQGIDQVNIAVTQMDKVTQSNAASAEESAAAASELDAQAGALRGAVGDLLALVGGAAKKLAVSSTPSTPAPRTAGLGADAAWTDRRANTPVPADFS